MPMPTLPLDGFVPGSHRRNRVGRSHTNAEFFAVFGYDFVLFCFRKGCKRRFAGTDESSMGTIRPRNRHFRSYRWSKLKMNLA